MKISQVMMVAGIAAALCAGINNGLAQNNNRGQGGDRQGGDRPGRGNFDPAQFRERMMERYKETLEVKDDAEWNAIQPLIQKVMDARMATMGGMGRGMGFGGPRRGGEEGGPGGGNRPGPFGQPNPAADTLQKAVDGKASNAELKSALSKYQDNRKAKQAELEKAQDDLRKVLSVRQEAIATLNGLL